ncbi:MAG: hypothetical protein ICV56_07445 [Nitrososphaeraceae archaeon]|nr:hypothetical protein [Nitrososphaeraceae archaeon]
MYSNSKPSDSIMKIENIIQLTFEDMWLSLQDYFDRLRDSPVVFPCCSKLILPTFEEMVNLLRRAPYTISEAKASLYLQSWPK